MPLADVLDAIEGCLANHGPGGANAPAAGSPADRSARRLRAAVDAFRDERLQPGRVRRILVAVDDSDQAAWAVRTAGRLAVDLAAELELVHVVSDISPLAQVYAFGAAAAGPVVGEPPLAAPVDAPAGRAARLAGGEKLLRFAEGSLGGGVNGRRVVREGDAAEQIVAAAREWPADLIVIGTHARGLVARFLMGGTAERVIRHAPCPVMAVAHDPAAVVPEAARSEPARGLVSAGEALPATP